MKTKSKPIKGYVIDLAANTVYMNFKFAAAAQQYGTEEYKIIQEIRADIPHITVVVRAGRKTTKCNASKNLTYANMERYIAVQDNADELMAAFAIAKEESKCESSPYAYVRSWFVAQFPNYKEFKTFDGGNVIPLAGPARQDEIVS